MHSRDELCAICSSSNRFALAPKLPLDSQHNRCLMLYRLGIIEYMRMSYDAIKNYAIQINVFYRGI